MAESAAEALNLPFAASDVVAEVMRWRAFLASERRMSPKTVEAYARDASQFLAFLAEHLGGKVTLARLVKLTPADVRAFMASRRADGIGSRSLMRALAGVRSFTRYPRTRGQGPRRRARPRCARRRSPRRCRSRSRSAPPSSSPTSTCAPARSASPGCSRATPPCWRCSTARGCASPKRSGSSARRCPRPARATPSPSPARATSSAWCRCCRRCSCSSRTT